MENRKITILSVVYFLSIFMLIVYSVITINSVFAQTQQQKVENATEVTNDYVFTTLRKDGAIYNLQQNITLPTGKDMHMWMQQIMEKLLLPQAV